MKPWMQNTGQHYAITLISFSFLTHAAFNPMPSSAEPVKLQGSRILPRCFTPFPVHVYIWIITNFQYTIFNSLYTRTTYFCAGSWNLWKAHIWHSKSWRTKGFDGWKANIIQNKAVLSTMAADVKAPCATRAWNSDDWRKLSNFHTSSYMIIVMMLKSFVLCIIKQFDMFLNTTVCSSQMCKLQNCVFKGQHHAHAGGCSLVPVLDRLKRSKRYITAKTLILFI